MSLLHKSLAINSVLILLSTSIIGTVLHELVHYVVSAHFGLDPTLHHNYVNSVLDGTPRQQMLVAAAGPMFSLMLGVLAVGVAIWLPRPSLAKLFLQWLGMGSILGFLGYLLIAPIAKEGRYGPGIRLLRGAAVCGHCPRGGSFCGLPAALRLVCHAVCVLQKRTRFRPRRHAETAVSLPCF